MATSKKGAKKAAPVNKGSKSKKTKTAPESATAQASPAPDNGPATSTGTRHFGEPATATVDGKNTIDGKSIDMSDKTYYNSAYYTQHEKTVQPFPASRTPAFMDLSSVLPAAAISKITSGGQITFHAVGDTGATSPTKLGNETSVVDMMVTDLKSDDSQFLFHLGDVVYEFGEPNYYYEQFYDPFRNYNAPIFAIPGNHDGMIYDASMKSLAAFLANFCTREPQTAPNAGGLIRSTMDQPGVYFTLDAPFVSIIGLYSNVIDGGPGVISTQGGKFPVIGDAQLDFLNSELARLKAKKEKDPRAIILALHHPPYSGDAKHGGSPRMSQDLDTAFTKAGLWPDAVLSGHAHHYERFSRKVNGKKMPYIIAGSGGYNMTPMPKAPTKFPFAIPGNTELALENYFPLYGYLEITVNGKSRQLTITFNATKSAKGGSNGRATDKVTVTW